MTRTSLKQNWKLRVNWNILDMGRITYKLLRVLIWTDKILLNDILIIEQLPFCKHTYIYSMFKAKNKTSDRIFWFGFIKPSSNFMCILRNVATLLVWPFSQSWCCFPLSAFWIWVNIAFAKAQYFCRKKWVRQEIQWFVFICVILPHFL